MRGSGSPSRRTSSPTSSSSTRCWRSATSASRRNASGGSRTSAPPASRSCSCRTRCRRRSSCARAPPFSTTADSRSTGPPRRPGTATASWSAGPLLARCSKRRIDLVATPPLVISQRKGVGALLESLRPRQWTKNVFVFAGLIFSGRLFDRVAVLRELAAFVVFCAAASAVYLANDAADREHDARHPQKRGRPIASGRLSPVLAVATAAALAGAAVAWSAVLSRELLFIVVG